MKPIPTLQGNPGESGLTAEITNGLTVKIVGKRVPTTEEEDRESMRRLWEGKQGKKTKQIIPRPKERVHAFGYNVGEMQQGRRGY